MKKSARAAVLRAFTEPLSIELLSARAFGATHVVNAAAIDAEHQISDLTDGGVAQSTCARSATGPPFET